MPSEREDVAHLFRRIGFGGLPAEIDALVALDWPDAVDAVLDRTHAPSATLGVPTLPAPGTALDATKWGDAYRSMVWWWLDRCRTTPVPVVEKLTLFWHGVLTSSLDVAPHKLLFDQNQLLRAHGLGTLDGLVTRVAKNPAMLIYLDNRANWKGYPNENFARELMELFLLGVGNYTEADVRESARAWTGHTMDTSTWKYQFVASGHDDGNKTFMGVTANWDGPQIIDHLVRGPKQRTTARFVARKLWTAIAAPTAPATLVDELATAFIAGDMRIDALLRAILLRPEFRSAAARDGVVRSPAEFVVAAMRYAGLQCSDVDPQWQMKGMGQELFLPPNVDGWGVNAAWISTAAGWAKLNFASQVAPKAVSKGLLADSTSRKPADAAAAALSAFGITAPTPTTLQALTDFVIADRAGGHKRERAGLVKLALLSPEFSLA